MTILLETAAKILGSASTAFAHELFPNGFDLVPEASDAPGSLADLNLTMPWGVVWEGASDQTIYGRAHTNHCARAWHDWTHWMIQADFSFDGEVRVAHAQARYMLAKGWATVESIALLFCEVIGQAYHKELTSQFAVDQVAFTHSHWENYIADARIFLHLPPRG